MALEANMEVMTRLQSFYFDLTSDEEFPQRERAPCQKLVNAFSAQMSELIYDTKMHIARARVLARVVNDRKAMVSLL